MIVTQTAASQREHFTRNMKTAAIATLAVLAMCLWSDESIKVKAVLSAIMVSPLALLTWIFLKRAALPDDKILRNRLELEITSDSFVIRRLRNGRMKKEKTYPMAKLSKVLRKDPYRILQFGPLKSVTIVATRFPTPEIEALCKELEARVGRMKPAGTA